MRVWDRIAPRAMCRQHLLGEHCEVHGLLRVLGNLDAGRPTGYSRHKETVRWLPARYRVALWRRHEALAAEMLARGYNHRSPVDGPGEPAEWVTTWPPPIDDQPAALRAKGCRCKV